MKKPRINLKGERCPVCERLFMNRTGLNRHMVSKHSMIAGFVVRLLIKGLDTQSPEASLDASSVCFPETPVWNAVGCSVSSRDARLYEVCVKKESGVPAAQQLLLGKYRGEVSDIIKKVADTFNNSIDELSKPLEIGEE